MCIRDSEKVMHDYFSLHEEEGAVIRLLSHELKYAYKGSFDVAKISADVVTFFDEFKANKLVPMLKSQDPLPKDGDIVQVVGKTFETLLMDNDKHVFAWFYAPWCRTCKAMKPEWEKLATLYKYQVVPRFSQRTAFMSSDRFFGGSRKVFAHMAQFEKRWRELEERGFSGICGTCAMACGVSRRIRLTPSFSQVSLAGQAATCDRGCFHAEQYVDGAVTPEWKKFCSVYRHELDDDLSAARGVAHHTRPPASAPGEESVWQQVAGRMRTPAPRA